VKQKHIVLVDGLWAGHHPIYVKTFAKLLLGAGYQVTVLCPAPDEVASEVGGCSSVEDGQLKAHRLSERVPKLLRYIPKRIRTPFLPLVRWWQVSQSLKAVCLASGKPDLVFFAWLDSYVSGYLPVKLIDWQFPFSWSGLYFHPRHLRASSHNGGPQKRWFALPQTFLAKSKWASAVAVLDAGVLNVLRAELHGKPAVALPDFTDETPPSDHCTLVDEIKSKAKGKTIIGLLGGLSRRKGLLTLIRIVRQSVGKHWYFVFAGELLEQTYSRDELAEVRTFFSAPREDCFFYLNRISDDAQFNAVVNICDVIFAVYENFLHSSNLVTKTAIFGKRILVSTGGYMEEVVREYALGESVQAGNVEAAIDAICRLASPNHSIERSSRMREYAREQSQDKLQISLSNLIERSMAHCNIEGNIKSAI
jgi:glycosyltransferase involved in cell wall biosynthesis